MGQASAVVRRQLDGKICEANSPGKPIFWDGIGLRGARTSENMAARDGVELYRGIRNSAEFLFDFRGTSAKHGEMPRMLEKFGKLIVVGVGTLGTLSAVIIVIQVLGNSTMSEFEKFALLCLVTSAAALVAIAVGVFKIHDALVRGR
jgi:hypothetical protein